jgi:hypothetical protein
MNGQGALDTLDQVLEAERDAIRRLDGAAVDATAAQKLDLVRLLTTLEPAERARLAPRLRTLVGKLRQNGVLLAHARSILRDILRVRGGQLAASAPGFPGRPNLGAGNRLSVRG